MLVGRRREYNRSQMQNFILTLYEKLLLLTKKYNINKDDLEQIVSMRVLNEDGNIRAFKRSLYLICKFSKNV